MFRHLVFLLLLSLLLCCSSAGQVLAEVKVIELRHRPASELAAVVEPLLGEEGSVSAYDSKLILKGQAKELDEIEKVVRQLDIDRRTLRLAVRQSASELVSGQEGTLGGRLQTASEAGIELSGRQQRTLSTGSDNSDQFLLVLEGEEGYITVGREVPFTSELAVAAGRHLALAQRTEFRQVSTGFWVRPQLLGETVRLELTPHMSSLDGQANGGDLTFHSLASTVMVPLGQWFNLAGHLENRDEVSQAILARRLGVGQSRNQVYIRVDAVDSP